MVQFVRLFGQRLPKPEYDLAVASLAGVIKETHVFELLIMLSISSSVITPVFLDYAAFYVRLLPTWTAVDTGSGQRRKPEPELYARCP